MIFAKAMRRVAVIAALTALLPAAASEAGFKRLRSDYEPGEVVVAKSRHGNGTVTGIVRPARYGWEVRLPHGTWVSCRRSCEESLRVQTVDMFENQGELYGYGTVQNECGLLRCWSLGF